MLFEVAGAQTPVYRKWHLCRIFSGTLPDLFCPFRVPKAVAYYCKQISQEIVKIEDPYPARVLPANQAASVGWVDVVV